MKKVYVPILILSIMMLFCVCSKDKDVEKLEKETMKAETSEYQTDSTAGEKEATEEMDTTSTEYAMTPETTPKEEPVEEPTSEYSGMGGYTVQIASGTNYDNVQYLLQKYLDRGYDAFISQANVNDELVYRLRIGNFDNYADAKAMAMELKDKYSVKSWIAINE